MSKKKTPAAFSAYVITWSDEPAMPVSETVIDKGSRLERDWTVMNFETGKETGAVGRRLARLCPECRVIHGRAGILGHDGDCGSDEARDEAMQVLADAKKRILAEVSA